MRLLSLSFSVCLSLLFFACDSGSTVTDAGPADSGGSVDSGGHADAGTDSGGSVDSGHPDAGGGTDAGPVDAGGGTDAGDGGSSGMVTLTVLNYLSWCNVTVGTGAPSVAASQTLMVAPGTVVPVNATAGTGFVFGYWFGTAGDTTSAHDTAMMTMVTVDTNKTIQACCPFPPPATPTCPAP